MNDAIDVRTWSRDALLDSALGSFRVREDAEDAVQDALLRLISQTGPAPDSPRAWLVRVTRNIAIDRWRRARLERTTLAFLADDVDEGPRTPEADLAGIETCREAIELLLAGSGPKEAAAALLHDVFGLSYAEIAGVGGGNEAAWRQTVRRTLMRARERARAASCRNRDGRNPAECPPDREADAVPERFRCAVLMADPAMLLEVLRVCAAGPPSPVEAASPSGPSGANGAIVGTPEEPGYRVRIRFELDGRGARVSLILGGKVLCTLSGTPAGSGLATLSGRSAPSPRCAAGTTASTADRTARA